MTIALHHADMLEWLRDYAARIAAGEDLPLFDSCGTDPPYHLTSIVKRFGKPGSAPCKEGATGAYARASRGFMGKEWDGGDIAFRPETWRAVFDVLKPGAHLVAFSSTRTYHRMTCAIEDAGFEIRDCLQWHYGSGFPKSHDVAKGIAKRRDEDVEPIRAICRFVRAGMDAQGLKSRDLTQFFGDCNPRLIDHWAARDTDSQPALPTAEQWMTLKASIPLGPEMDAEFDRLNARKGEHSDEWTGAEVIGELASTPAGFGDLRFEGDTSIRALRGEAAEWQGWGTALKPATELICLARKPLIGTVAENVLKYGTGALNIDGCRISTTGARNNGRTVDSDIYGSFGTFEKRDYDRGRWPANLLHDGSDEVVAAFPDSNGQQGDLAGHSRDRKSKGIYGDMSAERNFPARGDFGSAARFFYSAKAGPLDRLGSKHATVKPVDLMRWLVRLVTPPGGHVLDPFAGSGTTGIACIAEEFDCTLIELEAEHHADIERKLAYLRGEGAVRIVEHKRGRASEAASEDPGPLFGAAV